MKWKKGCQQNVLCCAQDVVYEVKSGIAGCYASGHAKPQGQPWGQAGDVVTGDWQGWNSGGSDGLLGDQPRSPGSAHQKKKKKNREEIRGPPLVARNWFVILLMEEFSRISTDDISSQSQHKTPETLHSKMVFKQQTLLSLFIVSYAKQSNLAYQIWVFGV
jgi:hypothetical protein